MTTPAVWVYDSAAWRSLTPGVADVFPATPPPPPPDTAAPPTFLGAGPIIGGTTGSPQGSWIAGHQSGDVCLVIAESANELITLTTPAGFVEGPSSPVGTGTAAGVASTRLAWFWKRATSNAEPPVALRAGGGTGNHIIYQMLFFRGCVASGNPWDVTAGTILAAAATAVSIAGNTTSQPNCLVLSIVNNGTDTTTGQVSAGSWANASLASLTELTNQSKTDGNGGGISVAAGVKVAAGAYGATTATLLTSSVQAMATIALAPSTSVAPGPGPGIPYMPYALFGTNFGGAPLANGFTGVVSYINPGNIIAFLNNLRARGMSAVLMTTDDGHLTYMSSSHFDIAKWKGAMDGYRTAAIIAAVAAAVADGTLLGISMLDEPPHPDWGGAPWMVKATLDEMTVYAKGIFPTVACGVACAHYWLPTTWYEQLDFIMTQTWTSTVGAGPTVFKTNALAQRTFERAHTADTKGISIVFSINLYAGTSGNMTPAEVNNWGAVLGPAGCAFVMYKYDPALWTAAYVTEYTTIAAALAIATPPFTFYRS